MLSFYIAHPFDSRYGIKDWINELEKNDKKILFINPFFPKRDTEKYNVNSKSCDEYYKMLNNKEIVEGDLKLIAQCDGVICIIDGAKSYGTIQEMVYAFILRKKIFTICTNGNHNHPWLSYHSDKVFTSFKEFEEFIKNEKF